MKQSYIDAIPKALANNERDYFAYGVDALALPAAGGVLNPTFTVQGDADFLLTDITGTARDPAAPSVRFLWPALMIEIGDGGSGRQSFSQALDWVTVVGIAQDPGELSYPKFFKRKGTVRVTITNISLAQIYDVRLSFQGFKIF